MKKFKKRMYGVLKLGVMVAIFATIAPIHALEDGAYLVARKTSYADPRTGKIPDGGSPSNEALGDSMANGIIEKQLLVEQVNGATYVTIGFGLMSNVNNVRLKLDDQPIAFTKTGSSTRDGDRVDHFRFQVSSLSQLVSPTIYVAPMGRDVTFFIQLNPANITAGTGVYNALLAKPISKEEPKKEASTPTVPNKAIDKKDKANEVKKKEIEQAEAAKKKEDEKSEDKKKVAFNDPLVGVNGLTKYIVTNKETAPPISPLVIAIGSILVVSSILAGYFLYKKKRGMRNEETV